ncbi:MAG: hypothetical protein IT462_11265 [Planctomycetes bacterium]|nr:hypothetical protein [Planctomycetota bacterium]
MRIMAVLLLCGAVFAPALLADEVRFRTNEGLVESVACEVTGWSWKEVQYKSAKGSAKVARKDLVAVQRTSENGTLSDKLSAAQSAMATDLAKARTLLEGELKDASSTAVNKEEATYLLADLALIEAGSDGRRRPTAIAAFKNYINSYKEGYFARQAYTSLAGLQRASKDVSGARETFKNMAKVGSGLDLIGSQLLGEFELDEKQWQAAVVAFKDAAKFAGSDKAARYKANAMQARALKGGGDTATAQSMLEEIKKDEFFNDPTTAEGDEVLSIVYGTLADILYDKKAYQEAYEACMTAAFYCWWLQSKGEGDFLAKAFVSARKTSVGADNWKTRGDKLEEVLAGSHSKELKAAREILEKDKPSDTPK